jgi:fructuronate reductase
VRRLSPETAHFLPEAVARPAWRGAGIGQVHLGIGAFHRAHQAWYTDAALAAGGGDWRIGGISLRSADVARRLNPQDGLYLLAERSAASERLQLMTAVADVLVAPEDPAAAIARIADPTVRIVTLTITEKGYCHDPATGGLDPAHPDIVYDLAKPERPRSAPGLLLAGLAARRAAGTAPPVVLSCDNLPDNGGLLGRLLAELAARQDDALGRWLGERLVTPATMVDRIVPATTPADIDAVAAATGLHDEGLVLTEPFSQWVIEAFEGPRPAWEAAGALFVADVRPFEHLKLRLLNGCHSAIAYLGQLAGWSHVHEAMADPALAAFVNRLMRAAEATLPPVPGLDIAGYRAELVARFANPALMHRTRQIAMDGSRKLPQRLIRPALDALARGQAVTSFATAIGAWIAFVVRETAAGVALDDPEAAALAARVKGLDAGAAASALLAFPPLFGPSGAPPALAAPAAAMARRLLADGVAPVLGDLVRKQAA